MSHCIYKFEKHRKKINQLSCNQNIQWHFTPAATPQFCGFWKSTEKLFKYLVNVVRRILYFLSKNLIHFHAAYSHIKQSLWAANLHSCPFLNWQFFYKLTGTRLDWYTGKSVIQVATFNQGTQHFWSKWQKEYINVRTKLTTSQHPIKMNAIVLIE